MIEIDIHFFDCFYSEFFVIPNNSHKILFYNIVA